MVPSGLAELKDRVRMEAQAGGMSIDEAAYHAWDRDPLEPLIGGGDEGAPLGFFGRDPGRDEVRYMEPLIGAAGRLVRAGVHRRFHGCDPADFSAARSMGQHVFFSNTVPYKPVGNKAWSMSVKRRFLPLIAEYLVDHWVGQDLITLGNVAFHWFGLSQPRDVAATLRSFWEREDRYEASLSVVVTSPLSSRKKTIHLHPLPHPSPLNARWYPRFPGLLDARLAKLDPP